MASPSTTVPNFLAKKRDQLLRFKIQVNDGDDSGNFPAGVEPFLVPILRQFERYHFQFSIIS